MNIVPNNYLGILKLITGGVMQRNKCPICKAPINDKKITECPNCGEKISFKKSKGISHSGDKILNSNGSKSGAKMIIREGKRYAKKQSSNINNEESIAPDKESTIKVDSPNISTSHGTNTFKSNISEATVEEKVTFNFKDLQPKQSTQPKKKKKLRVHRTKTIGEKKLKPNVKKRKPKRISKIKIKGLKIKISKFKRNFEVIRNPLIAAIIGILILSFTILSVYKYSSNSTTIGLQKQWEKSVQYFLKGHEYYKEAVKKDKRGTKYYAKLQLASNYYKKGIELGQKCWNAHIAALVEKKNMPPKKAEKYAIINHGGYLERLNKRKKEYKKITKLLSSKRN